MSDLHPTHWMAAALALVLLVLAIWLAWRWRVDAELPNRLRDLVRAWVECRL